MAVVLNTSAGFVSTAPSADPGGGDTTIDGSSVVVKDTSPAGAVKITEIGWYRGSGTNTANFEVALYADEASVAGTRLYVDATNSSSAGGWITVAVDWQITPSTAYWLGLQMDAHTGSSTVDNATSGGSGTDVRTSQTTLNNPYGGGAVADADGLYAIYALYQKSPTVALNTPADAATGVSTTPVLDFTGTDPEANDVRYEVQVHTDNTFLTQIASDNFNRADGGLGGNWTTHASRSNPVIVSNAVSSPADDDDATGYWTGSGSFSDNQYSQATITWGDAAGTGTSYAGLLLRSGSTSTIFCQKDRPTGDTVIVDVTSLDTSPSYSEVGRSATEIANGSVVRAEVIGSTVYIYDDEALVLTATTSLTTGKPGILLNDNTDVIDNWSGGNTTPLIDAVSGTDAGFANPDVGGDTDPFTSGENIQYTVQSALSNSTQYYWRVRGIDPSGSNLYGAWATTRSFTTASAGGATYVNSFYGGGGYF